MSRLSTQTLNRVQEKISTPDYDRDAANIGIVHFGIGAFHQAHQAVFTDAAMAKSGGHWGICGVSLNSAGSRRRLAPQDGLYTLSIRDRNPSLRIIGSIKEILFAGEAQETILARLCATSTKFVTLTITEKGYALTGDGQLDLTNPMIASDVATPEKPSSAMGYINLVTKKRDLNGLPPLTIISCDNLPANGDKLKAACIRLAEQSDKELATLISSMRFPNTMVDSITPATNQTVLEHVSNRLSLEDQGAVQREAFAQWVIEDNLPEDRPDWAGVGATITNDVHGFEMTKLRILNGAHSSLTYLGLLAGLESVEDTISQPELRAFIDNMIRWETIPTISAPYGLDLEDYWTRTIVRFENPHIRHLIEQISHDGSQKIPARIVPVIVHHELKGQIAQQSCFVVAAWIIWNRQRRTEDHPPIDAYLTQTENRLPDKASSVATYVEGFLDREDIFPQIFRDNSKIRQSVLEAADIISVYGVKPAMKTMMEARPRRPKFPIPV